MCEHAVLPELPDFPLVNPGKPTSLRRSHSVASLPTPPSTIRKRPRSRASSCFSSDDEDAAASADDVLLGLKSSPQPRPQKKKRRVDDGVAAPSESKPSPPSKPTPAAEADEDEFWGPTRSTKLDKPAAPKPRGRAEKRAPSPTASASRAAAAATLLSPPPTRRPAPVTPPRRVEKGKTKTTRPVRDSPNNPFLESPEADAGSASAPTSPVGPKTPLAEPPTMTYVFRGKKQIFVNPNYNAPHDPRTDLPESHPDYSPGERCAPRRLFAKRGPTVKAKSAPDVKSKGKPTPERRSASPDPWSSDEERVDTGVPRLNLAQKLAAIAAEGKHEAKAGSSRARSSSAAASSETAVRASSETVFDASPETEVKVRTEIEVKAKVPGKHFGQPKLVLAPTDARPRAKTRRTGSSATLTSVDDEDDRAAEAEKDSWAVL